MKAKSPSAELLAGGKLRSTNEFSLNKGASSSSIGELNQTESSDLAEELGFDVTDIASLETAIFTCINEDNRSLLLKVFEKYPSDTTVLQVLLTTSYPNRDGFYRHDADTLDEAAELLGPNLENLNALQVACLLGEEDIALDILEFVTRITDEIQSKKILFEFMGRIWGDGNSTLHLASFMGMTDVVTLLLELGAAKGKMNDRKYKPVDCTNDQQTRVVFETIDEVNPVRRLSIDTTSSFTASIDGFTPTGVAMSASAAVPPPSRPMSEMATTAAATNARHRSSSGGGSNKPRSHRSGTASQKDFPTKMLARDTKKVKNVNFDRGTLLLHLCQFPDDNQDQLEMVKECLGLTDETSTCSLDVNNTYSPQQWLTPLHIACSYGFVEVAKLLIERAGAAVNITDKEGWTPLHCACAEGQVEVIRMLTKCQGNLAHKEEGEGKGWIYALDGPINLEQENDDGDIPEEVSLEDKEDDIISILKECKRAYPPPPRIPREPASESDEEDDDEEEEIDEPSFPSSQNSLSSTIVSPLKMDSLKRANTASRSPGPIQEKRFFEKEVTTSSKIVSDNLMSIPTASEDLKRPPSANKFFIPPPPSSPRPDHIAITPFSAVTLAASEEPSLRTDREEPSCLMEKAPAAVSTNIPAPDSTSTGVIAPQVDHVLKTDEIIPFPVAATVSGSQPSAVTTDTTPKKGPQKLAKLIGLGAGMGGEHAPISPLVDGLKKQATRKGSISKDFPQSPTAATSEFVPMSGEQLKRPLQRRSSKSSPALGNPTSVSHVSKITPNVSITAQVSLGVISPLKKSPGPPIAKKPDALSATSLSYSLQKTPTTSPALPSQLPIAILQKSNSSEILSPRRLENLSSPNSSIPVSIQQKAAFGSSEMLPKSKKMDSESVDKLAESPVQKSSPIETIAKRFTPTSSTSSPLHNYLPSGSNESLTRPKDFSEDDLTSIAPQPVIIGKLNKERIKLFDKK